MVLHLWREFFLDWAYDLMKYNALIEGKSFLQLMKLKKWSLDASSLRNFIFFTEKFQFHWIHISICRYLFILAMQVIVFSIHRLQKCNTWKFVTTPLWIAIRMLRKLQKKIRCLFSLCSFRFAWNLNKSQKMFFLIRSYLSQIQKEFLLYKKSLNHRYLDI